MSTNEEQRISKLLEFPYGSFLMVRLEYMLICGDELEAKILRLVEIDMDMKRRGLYQEHMASLPKGSIPTDQVIDITKDVWVPISYRTFTYDLYNTVKSDNTLKRAIKSLLGKGFLSKRHTPAKQYDAPEYQINVEKVQEEFGKLKASGKAGYQKLIPSNSDTLKNPSPQKLTPSEYQFLILSSDFRVSKFDTNSRIENTVDITVESNGESVGSDEPNTLPLTDLESAITLLARNGYHVSPLAEPGAHHQGFEHTTHAVSTDQGQDAASVPTFQLTLTGELTPGYALTHPLIVNVARQRDGMWIVSEGRYAHFAVERTQSEAIAAFKSTLVDECIHLGRDEANLAPHLLEELAYLRSLISHQEPVILPPQPVENAPVASISPNATPAPEIAPQRENEALATTDTRRQPSYSRNNATATTPAPSITPGGPPVVQEKLLRPERPVMPPAEMKWCAEKLVQITEARRFVNGKQGAYFDETTRGKSTRSQRQRQLDAAKTIIEREITEAQYLAAYDDVNDDWWNDNKGSVTVETMAANTPRKIMRAIEVTEKLESRSATIPTTSKRSAGNAHPARPNKTAYTEDELKLLRRMTTEQRKEWIGRRRQAKVAG